MDVNKYLNKQYGRLGCWLLIVDIYMQELGLALQEYVPESATLKTRAAIFRRELHNNSHGFLQIKEPTNFCVVTMAKLKDQTPHHVGIYYNGKVIHALNDMNYYQDIFSLSDQYQKMEYWTR